MDDPSQKQIDQWQSAWMDAVSRLAQTLKELEGASPWLGGPTLLQAMNYLMTELWDRGFSQTEIREALNDAVIDMPRYAAGDEVRR